jgi:hypothetical protein
MKLRGWDGKDQPHPKSTGTYTVDHIETPESRKGYYLQIIVIANRHEYEWMSSRN